MLSFQDVTYGVAGRSLLEKITFQIPLKHHVALIGRNGAGKSTLFRLMLKEIEPDSGIIELSKNLKIGTVPQEVPGGDKTPLELLLSAEKESFELFEKLKTCQDSNILADIYDRLIQMDAYSLEGKAVKILKGLGFSDEDQTRPLKTFSGGYRMRVALASILFQQPDILLLDEPTNHLDLPAIIWLKNFLKSYPSTFIVVSHDRDFLNHCVETVLHLHSKKITTYKGNYDKFLKTSQEKKAALESYNKKVEAHRQHLQKFVDRFRATASKAAQAQSRLKALEKLTFVNIDQDDPTIKITFPEIEPLSPPLIHFENIALGYNETPILKNISESIGTEDRIALLGANGQGKSTFAKFLAGHLKPQKGIYTCHPKLRIGFFQQHQLEALNERENAYEHVKNLAPEKNETQARTHLGCFGFSREKADLAVKDLSGGEKARLSFCLLSLHKPQLIILDEPTNHLDIEMRESLMMALQQFKGAVLIIAHDWHLLQHTADRLWIVENNTIKSFSGTLRDYQKKF